MNEKTPAICGQAVCGQTICGDQNIDSLKSIQITTPPTKLKYLEGQRFNSAGMVVTAHYNNRSEIITDYTISPSEALRGNINSVVVSYTKNGITKTAKQDLLIIRNMQSDKMLINKLNRAGTGALDLYSKNIRFAHEDISLDLLHLPFNISHIYNAKNAENTDCFCGFGWRTNLHQQIVTPNSLDGDDASYVYIDGNGDRNRILLSKDSSGNVQKDKDGEDVYVLENDKSLKYSPTIRCIYRGDRKSESLLYFDEQKRLQQQVFNRRSRMYIKYKNTTSMQIDSVRDHYSEANATKIVTFNYLTNNKLGSISYAAPLAETINIYFTYTNSNNGNNLMRINYQSTMSADYTSFIYFSDGLLQSVRDPIGHSLTYDYFGDTITVTETPGSVVFNPMLKLTEKPTLSLPNKVWSVKYSDNTRITKDGTTSVIGFDLFGSKYAYTFIDKNTESDHEKLNVTDDLEIDLKRNDIEVAASLSKNLRNYANEADFESNFTGWTTVGTTYLTDKVYVKGFKSLCLVPEDTQYGDRPLGKYSINGECSKIFTVANSDRERKKGYVISCFCKCGGGIKAIPVTLYAELQDASGNTIDSGKWIYNSFNEEWQAGIVCLNNNAINSGSQIVVKLINRGMGDKLTTNRPIYFDNLRIVESTFTKTEFGDDSGSTNYYQVAKQVKGTGETIISGYDINEDVMEQKYTDDKNITRTTTYTYDKFGNITKQIDTLNNILTEYKYDGYMGGCSSYRISSGDSACKEYIDSSSGIPIIDVNEGVGGKIQKTLTMTDSKGLTTQYNLKTSKINYYEDSEGNKTSFYYNLGLLKTMSINSTQELKNDYRYTKFLLTRVESQNNTVYYVYDGYGKLFQIYLNDKLLKEYTYRDNCNYAITSNINNFNFKEEIVPSESNSTFCRKIIYNADGQPLYKQEKCGSENYKNVVTANFATTDTGGYKQGELISLTDVAMGEPVTKTFNYDSSNRKLVKMIYSGARNGSISCLETPAGLVTNKTVTFGSTKQYEIYSSLPNKDIYEIDCNTGTNKIFTEYAKDKLNRDKTKLIFLGSTMSVSSQNSYALSNNEIYKVTHEIIDNSDSIRTILEHYTYDSNKNISSYTNSTHFIKVKYKYDELGRLIREDNVDFNFTKIYTYSDGNIKTVTIYPCETLDSPPTGEGLIYTYNYQGETDKLTDITGLPSFGNINSYDLAGNPLQWRGNSLQWSKSRQLMNYGSNISYKYDSSGIRQEKIVDGMVHKYYTEGNLIHKEERGSDTLWYTYDNVLNGIEYNGEQFIFCKSMQDDVSLIFDKNGNIAASYKYDAWGNHKVFNGNGELIYDSISGEVANGYEKHIGNVNPFRYRSYYFDTESRLYYLQTRYYDSEIGRFLNADNINYIDPSSFNGLNLYTYCFNNPIMNFDPTGHFPVLIAMILGVATMIGSIIGGKIAYDNAIKEEKAGFELFWNTVGGIFLGGSVGLAAGGLALAIGAAGAVIIKGAAATFLGIGAIRAFAIGVLAYNFFAGFVAPIIGLTIDMIEGGGQPYQPPKPNVRPNWQNFDDLAISKNLNKGSVI